MSAQAQIADRRFQHYEGPSLGVAYAFFALLLHSIRWVVGLKRSTRYKIVPIIVIAIAYLPSLILIVIATVAPPGTPLPDYAGYYQFVIPSIYIFVALTAPELICPDRRHGTLRMYWTSNLGPFTYLAAKLGAIWVVLSMVTVGPVLIQLAGYSLFGHGPLGLSEGVKTFVHVVGGGLTLAVFYGSIALAVSSLTDRNSFASAGIILGFILSGAALGILQGPLKAPAWVALVNINQLPVELINRIHQSHGFTTIDLPTWELAAGAAGWAVAAIAMLAFRYWNEGRR
jgi:ABC-2 type transport system permease protein